MIFRVFLLVIFMNFIDISCYDYSQNYLDVPIDHFNFVSNKTFKLRFLDNVNYWDEEHGPIFFYTGNEGPIDSFANNTGFMWDIAESFKARLVFAEHRYYGKSLPFDNVSLSDPEHFGYLSSSQALRDYVYLIDHLQSRSEKKIPVIAFGGSYGGMLAAWLRMKYPASVKGAIASSAPILLFNNLQPCYSFKRVLSLMFPESCRNNIRKSWILIRNKTIDDKGRIKFSNDWKLCNNSKLNSSEDVNKLIESLEEIYASLAMLNYPYEAHFMVKLPANPVDEFCKFLNDPNLRNEQLLNSLLDALKLYTNHDDVKNACVDLFNIYPNLDLTAWNIQSCTEMVFPMCSDGIHDMFEKKDWNFSSYSETCYKSWKVKPQLNLAVLEYGGNKIDEITNIVFSNGVLDPWQCGGVNINDTQRSLYSILIASAAHHLDLRGHNSMDPKSVRNARSFYVELIKKWINDRNHRD